MQSTTGNAAFASDPYYFLLLQNAGFVPLTEPPQLLPDPSLGETFDLSWFTPSANISNFLHRGGLLDSSDQGISNGNYCPIHSSCNTLGVFVDITTPSQSASGSKTRTGSAISPLTSGPRRRVQGEERRNEAQRISILQKDKYVVSFTEARVICAGCQKSIKLDTRDGARYYPGGWVRHRKNCKGVKKLQQDAERHVSSQYVFASPP